MSITATNIIAIIHDTEVSLVITNKQRPTKNNEPLNIISVLFFVCPKTVMHVKGIAKAPKIMPILAHGKCCSRNKDHECSPGTDYQVNHVKTFRSACKCLECRE